MNNLKMCVNLTDFVNNIKYQLEDVQWQEKNGSLSEYRP